MPGMDLRAALDAAVDAASAAGAVLRDDFHRPGGPRGHVDKAEADLEAEGLIRGRLLAAFPGWGYLGEETGRAAGEPGRPIWLVDPNDGTRDYLVGRRGSTVSIGLVHLRRPVLGVVFAFGYPDDGGDLFAWAEGCGPVLRNGRPIAFRPSGELSARDVVLVSSKGDRAAETNLRCAAPARYRPVPSIAHRLALVAAGEAAAATSIHSPGAWDYGAGHALLRGAGGVLVNESGEEIAYADDGSSQALRAFGAAPGIVRRIAARPWESALTADGPPSGDAPARLRRGHAVRDSALLGRAQGCLLGQIAGDSLGSLVEFQTSERIARDSPDGPRDLQDGGEWRTLAGQPTDDSEMALALARALVAQGGYDASTVLGAYQEWYRSGPFDIGQTTRAALEGNPMSRSEANGSLMRVSPLGIFAHALPPGAAAELARRDSALTHPSAVPADAAAAFVVAVSHAVGHGDGSEAAWSAALSWARDTPAAPAVIAALERAALEAPVCDGDSQGWALIALQAAFYAVLHSPGPEDGIVSTVRRGGDTDTNAAIAGALLGAVHGRGSIPDHWRSMVLSCRPHAVCAPRPRPIQYWPGDVLELAELLLLAGKPAATPYPAAAVSVL
jgi:ADP-ribosylglycohydrolase/fructose-1,6-bisphosphatase/inositol monophosphatase family enzyme